MGATTIILVIAAMVAALLPSGAGAAGAAPKTTTAFDLSAYQPVNPNTYRSLAYANNGRHYFRVGQWKCQIGPQPGAAACQGKPRTAPPGVIGVAVSGEQQGPYWVRGGTTYQLGPVSPFRAPTLAVGTRITVADVTCAAPKAGVVVCRNWNRGFRLSRGSHMFLYPRGDRAHDGNPRIKH